MTTDERLDALDLEIIGLQRIQARETRDKLAARGYALGLPAPAVPTSLGGPHGETARAGSRVAPALRIEQQPRSATGQPLLVREACGQVLGVR